MKTATFHSFLVLTLIACGDVHQMGQQRASSATVGQHAQAASGTPEWCGGDPGEVIIVFDKSGSMDTQIGDPSRSKLAIANEAVGTLVTTHDALIDFGLATFPGPAHCEAGRVDVAPAPQNGANVIAALPRSSSGMTPIGGTLAVVRDFLLGNFRGVPQHVLLVTDGMWNCVGDPVAEATALFHAGIPVYVVGFGAGVSPSQLTALAQAGGTTAYYQADDADQLNAALRAITNRVLCCGDGVLQSFETCDIGISWGAPGACPRTVADCHDGDRCKTFWLEGQDCQTVCRSAIIPNCVDGCGNGIFEPQHGELCDIAIALGQVGACPTSCDDGDPCTVNELLDAGTCQAQCRHTPIPDCVDGCGNGVLNHELGHTCDTKIPLGEVGACPVSCEDGDPCTEGILEGAGTCNASCRFEPIPGCVDGCGNGRVNHERDHTCDIAIAQGEQGACPTDVSACDDGDPCTIASLRVEAPCIVYCDFVEPEPLHHDIEPIFDTDDPRLKMPDYCFDPCRQITCPEDSACLNGLCVAASEAPGQSEEEARRREQLEAALTGGCACRHAGEVPSLPDASVLILAGLWLVSRRRSAKRR